VIGNEHAAQRGEAIGEPAHGRAGDQTDGGAAGQHQADLFRRQAVRAQERRQERRRHAERRVQRSEQQDKPGKRSARRTEHGRHDPIVRFWRVCGAAPAPSPQTTLRKSMRCQQGILRPT